MTWIEEGATSDIRNKCIIEYKGVQPDSSTHGKAVRNQVPYVRMQEATKKTILAKKDGKSMKIYRDMILNDSSTAPRDTAQVRRLLTKDKKDNNQTHCGKNIADQVQTVHQMLHEHPFVRCVASTKKKLPSIYLYLDNQISQMQAILESDKVVLGIDRTFNLGECFVTSTVFRCSTLLRKDSNNSPTFFCTIDDPLGWRISYIL